MSTSYAKAYLNRGVAKYGLKQYADAIQDYDIAIRLKPSYAKAYLNRAVVKHRLGHTREAKRNLQTALKLAEQAGDVLLKTKIESTIRDLD